MPNQHAGVSGKRKGLAGHDTMERRGKERRKRGRMAV